MPISIGTLIGGAMDAADIGSTFVDSRKKGKGFIGSAASAAGQQALWMFAPAMMWTNVGLDLAKAGRDGMIAYGSGAGKVYAGRQERQYSHNLGGGSFLDTQTNATMRQRGMTAIQQSGQNLNSVFGGEARTYFRGSY